MSNFNLLSDTIQKKVWEMGWERFTTIQELAIPVVLNEESDAILCASTASGKTEAAFLPILSKIEEAAQKHLKVLYISPLKALINNQFERTAKLCDGMNIHVHKWHGDIGAHKKKKFVAQPTGILQITPESIESLFINRTSHLTSIFSELEFVIIDEIHSFIGTERGVHLRSLLSRISEKTKCKPRIIGLSATISDFDVAKRWVRPEAPQNVQIINDTSSGKNLLYHLMYIEKDNEIDMYEDLRSLTMNKKAIIFCNDRGSVEYVTVMLNRLAKKQLYYPHHSSIDKKDREYVEKIMAESEDAKSIVSTSTLELGIDIGNIDLVVQIDSTFSVSALKQRLGRSGRKAGAHQMLQLYATEPANLLRAIAVMELSLDHWVEPVKTYKVPYDISFHQIISICAQFNGIQKETLVKRIKSNAAFYMLEEDCLLALIDKMIENDMLEFIEGAGEVIVGLKGERLLRSKEFYTVFKTPEEYDVIDKNRKVGRLDKATPFQLGDRVMLAGQLWSIIEINDEKNKLYVTPAPAAAKPRFRGCGINIHKRIGEKMYEVLCCDNAYHYIDESSSKQLQNLRISYQLFGVDANERAVWQHRDEYILDVFSSGTILETLRSMLNIIGIKTLPTLDFCTLKFKSTQSVEVIRTELLSYAWHENDFFLEGVFDTKFASFLPDSLERIMYAKHCLDLQGAIQFLKDYTWKCYTLKDTANSPLN